MGNRLYVGNLAFGTNEETVRNAFGQAGEVTEVPGRAPGRGPHYWKSKVLRRQAPGDEGQTKPRVQGRLDRLMIPARYLFLRVEKSAVDVEGEDARCFLAPAPQWPSRPSKTSTRSRVPFGLFFASSRAVRSPSC